MTLAGDSSGVMHRGKRSRGGVERQGKEWSALVNEDTEVERINWCLLARRP